MMRILITLAVILNFVGFWFAVYAGMPAWAALTFAAAGITAWLLLVDEPAQ